MRILDAGLVAKESKGVRSSLGVTYTLRGSRTGLKLGGSIIFWDLALNMIIVKC